LEGVTPAKQFRTGTPFRKPESAKDSSLELAAAGNAIASYW